MNFAHEEMEYRLAVPPRLRCNKNNPLYRLASSPRLRSCKNSSLYGKRILFIAIYQYRGYLQEMRLRILNSTE